MAKRKSVHEWHTYGAKIEGRTFYVRLLFIKH